MFGGPSGEELCEMAERNAAQLILSMGAARALMLTTAVAAHIAAVTGTGIAEVVSQVTRYWLAAKGDMRL